MEKIKSWIIKPNNYRIIFYKLVLKTLNQKNFIRFVHFNNLLRWINSQYSKHNIVLFNYYNIFETRFLSNALQKLVILFLPFPLLKGCRMKNKCFTEKKNSFFPLLFSSLYRKNLVLSFFSLFLFFQSYSQCSTLELTTNNTSLCQPALFKWVVKNAPAGSSYYWDFGSGGVQGQDTFYALLYTPGIISVSVQVQFPTGKVCTIRKKNFVEVFAKPVPAFYSSRQKLCHGADTVTYFDITPNSAKRSWVIDGTNHYSAPAKQIHSYASTGIKRLSLIVEDSNGCRAIKEFDTAAIIYKDVILDFSADKTSGCIIQSIKFKPIINKNGANLISYNWSFPGGFPIQQFKEDPDTIKYNFAGSFSPSLEVTTDKGCVHTITKQNFMAFGFIDSLSIKISDTTICQRGSLTIENINKSLPGKLTWNLGGITSVTKPDQYTCIARYDTLGKFNVSVSYDFNGCTVSKLLTKIIRVKGVIADFTSLDYYHCLLPHTVHFTNLSKSNDAGKMIYQWMIYSGSKLVKSSNNINDSFRVRQTGSYDVVLIARHGNGCKDTMSEKNYIRSRPIMPNFDAVYKVGCIGQNIEFLQKTPPSSYKAPDRFNWTFYDKDNTKILGYSNDDNPKFAYSDTGFYSVKMIADNGIGCKDSVSKLSFIEIVYPKINFELLNPIICKNEALIGKGKSEPKRANFNYFWYLEHKNSGTQLIGLDSVLNSGMSTAGEYNFKFAHEINKGCRDSIVNNDFIKINGISAQMQLDTFNGCTPLTVKPQVLLTENYHFGDTSDRVIYKWTASPASNVIIKNDTTVNPEFTFNTTGEYKINLEVINTTGCRHNISSQSIYVGVKAAFDVSDYVVCANSEILLTDRSYLLPTNIKWLLEPDAITANALDQNQINIKYNNDGNHKVGLVAAKLNQCFDTVYKTVKSIIVKADLLALETTMKCAPVYAQFISSSKYADSLKWDFGDSNIVTTTDAFVANIYRKNSGSKKGFDISLIAKSNEGCSDTLSIKNYIYVLGPVPRFELSNANGCEPLLVKFKNTSTDVFKHYLNYDDGSPLDSTFDKNWYSIITAGLDTQKFIPRMYAIDSLGCKATYESPVPVVVKRNAKASFIVSDSILCENQTLNYSDKAVSVLSSDFYINEKGLNASLLKTSTITFYKKGDYQFTQIVKNRNDCVDSMKINIKVYSNPVADFVLNDTLCLSKILNFTNTSTGNYPLTNYYWEILNPSSPVIYYSKDIVHTFDAFGPASVGLTVTDSNGCQNTNLRNYLVPNPADIPSGELEVVSVNVDSSIQVISKVTNYNRFLKGDFYYSDSVKWIRATYSKKVEKFDYWNKQMVDSAQCFYFNITDVCGYESSLGKKHCTVFLKVIGTKPFTNQLNWTPYIGWPSVDNYTIYRKKAGDLNYTLLTSVDYSTNSLLDSGLCNVSYSYYVEASYQSIVSRSNVESHIPLFNFPPAFKDIKNVSVIDFNTIEVKWETNSNSNFYNYILYRTNVQTNKTDIIYTITNSYIDKDVNTNLYNYIYQVSETDKCGYQSEPKYEGKNIILHATSSDYNCFANWDTYKSWSSGVKEYNIQIEKEGCFKTIYTTSNIDSAFIHDQTLENIHGPYCYRIMAISGNAKDTSLSNIACVISPSTLFFPNAFTPNGDNINEKISVRSLFVYDNTNLTGRNFTLEIFNRWGERVYLSHAIDGEWDGIYEGKQVQTGVYIYRLKAMGVDNRSYSLKGTITIVP